MSAASCMTLWKSLNFTGFVISSGCEGWDQTSELPSSSQTLSFQLLALHPKLHTQFNPLGVFLACWDQGQNDSGAGPCLLISGLCSPICFSLSSGALPRGVVSSATRF